MKYKLLRLYIELKNGFKENKNSYYFEKELRRKRTKEIALEILSHPLQERLEMLKKIEYIVLIESQKQKLEFKEMYLYWEKNIEKYNN